jgi:hypothetical protein
MGHGNGGHVESDYIERLPDDERLIGVADHVRAWLYAKPEPKAKGKTKASSKLRIVG